MMIPDDQANRDWMEQVRPGGWTNPTPTGPYNLVVIGAGTAGLVSAAGAAGLGAKVALIERHLMGGDCLNVGCVPSKGILRTARLMGDLARAASLGVDVAAPSVDFPRVMRRMRELRAKIAPHDGAERFRSLGVDVFFGQARFVSPTEVEVGSQRLTFRKAIIATGARAAIPPIPGLAEAQPLTNETIFHLTELPGRLAVIGGGPIGCELAQAMARFGSKVMLLEQGDHLLAKEDPEAGNLVQGALEKSGVEVRCRTRLASVEMLPGPVRRLVLESSTPSPDPARQEKVVEVDAILVAVGRAPNVEGLGLEQAGVRTSPAGVAVDDYLRTSNRRIFAVGDIASAFKFTHAADALARVAIRNALFLGRSKASHLTIPWCTYTDPEVAHVGLSLRRARDAGMPIRTFEQRLDQVDRAILDGDEEGFIRIHTAADSDRILGATIVARHAGDLIGEITLAMRHQVGLGGIASVIHPYPTQADGIRRLGDAYQRTRLTPTVAKLFRAWLAWCRSY